MFNPNPDLATIEHVIKNIRARVYRMDDTHEDIIHALNGYLDLLDGLQTYDSDDMDQLVWDQEKFWQADEGEIANGKYHWQ